MRYLLVVALLLAVVTPVLAQHAANREWWKQEVTQAGYDPDRRLEQSVSIESSGHAMVVTLAALSKKTGVSLKVAPEDLTTVGERKLALFAKGVSLKSLMVRIPEALQECHWDVQPGAKPSYLLHRNSDVEATLTWLRERRRTGPESRPAREARIKAALAALTMSPEQLAELSKTDPFLVRSVIYSSPRPYLETLAALPQKRMAQFLDTGRIQLELGELASELRQQILTQCQQFVSDNPAGGSSINIAQAIIPNPSHAVLEFSTSSMSPSDMTPDPAVFCTIRLAQKDSTGKTVFSRGLFGEELMYAKYFGEEQKQLLARLSQGASESEREEFAVWRVEREDQIEAQRAKEQSDLTDPELQQIIALKLKRPLELSQVQQLLAQETGLTVVSDYFTDYNFALLNEAADGLPLWRLLCLIGDKWDCNWQKSGKIIVFHRKNWFDMIRSEIPESLLIRYQQKLEVQGRLTLDDVAAFRSALPDALSGGIALPYFLTKAGLTYTALLGSEGWGLRLYASLSPAQKTKAYSAAGLSFYDMTLAQRQKIEGLIFCPVDRLKLARFYIKQDAANSDRLIYDLSLRLDGEKKPHLATKFVFPDQLVNATVGQRAKKP